ncbi:sugar ABC transporter permease [Orenia marismortui]|uniref:Maltose/maltodextrin transport system permease protein n=1 Tax=Orenia marismortui TaxID=46469 RepID=A0A4R8GZ18_9FIRM|nr:sugar ABC transporter permease [Orenia marismortui]TDX51839.1 carbohydrate ABC transporter membrane protein 1 (CUT1 family) [Orenia marismortui]
MKAQTSINTGPNSNKARNSAILSTFIMGAGQIYNGQYIKGALFLLYYLAFWLQSPAYFMKNIKGLITLGTAPGKDHSLFILIYGIVSAVLLLVVIGIHIFNIIDAYRNGKILDNGEEVPSFRESLKNFWDIGFPYAAMSPGMIFLFIATIFPLIFTVSLAFTNYDLYHSPPGNLVDWVGLGNFKSILTLASWRRTFVGVFTWTVIWAITNTFLIFGLGLFLAVVLNHKSIKGRNILRTILMVPYAIPAFISTLIWRGLLNYNFGQVNKILASMGLGKVPWLQDAMWAKVAVILVNLWLSFPFAMALCSGVIQSISDTLYEAAEVDGATPWQKFTRITLPLVLRQIAPLMIMQFAFHFNNMGIIYLLNDGNPAVFGNQGGAGGTDILISWVYKLTMDKLKYNYAAAISIIIFFIVAGFSVYQFRRTNSFKEEELM